MSMLRDSFGEYHAIRAGPLIDVDDAAPTGAGFALSVAMRTDPGDCPGSA